MSAKPKTRPTPSIEQIICWCAAHNIHLERATELVVATAFDWRGDPISRTFVMRDVEIKKLPTQEEDLPLAIEVCDTLADELCLLKPSIAVILNSQ